MSNQLAVIGAGSWGTALAMVLSRNGHQTRLWGRSPEHIEDLCQHRCNKKFLADIAFPPSLEAVSDLKLALQGVDAIIIAVPCAGLRSILEQINEYCQPDVRVCLSSKGLEQGTHLLGHEVVAACLGDAARIAILSGPSFAKEVALKYPTAVTIASSDRDTAGFFTRCFCNDQFRTYTHDDVIGVQIGAAVKNVIAIATGIADGLGYGANTRSALITRSLQEIIRLGLAKGAKAETFMGLAGLGDLILTTTDDQSRNRRMGLALAAGKSVDEAELEIGQAVEGIKTVTEVCELARQLNIEMPISEQVLAVVCAEITADEAVKNLLKREPGDELPGAST